MLLFRFDFLPFLNSAVLLNLGSLYHNRKHLSFSYRPLCWMTGWFLSNIYGTGIPRHPPLNGHQTPFMETDTRSISHSALSLSQSVFFYSSLPLPPTILFIYLLPGWLVELRSRRVVDGTGQQSTLLTNFYYFPVVSRITVLLWPCHLHTSPKENCV